LGVPLRVGLSLQSFVRASQKDFRLHPSRSYIYSPDCSDILFGLPLGQKDKAESGK
jgi:hypothetical protein